MKVMNENIVGSYINLSTHTDRFFVMLREILNLRNYKIICFGKVGQFKKHNLHNTLKWEIVGPQIVMNFFMNLIMAW